MNLTTQCLNSENQENGGKTNVIEKYKEEKKNKKTTSITVRRIELFQELRDKKYKDLMNSYQFDE